AKIGITLEEFGARHCENLLPSGPGWVPGPLFQQRLDQLGEAVPCPVETALDRPQVTARDLGDLRVALALQLAQHEHRPVVRGELVHALVHRLLEVALAEIDRKSTRLNSSHRTISYAVFCLKKKKANIDRRTSPQRPPPTRVFRYCPRPLRDLHSFPTRRSSDLPSPGYSP